MREATLEEKKKIQLDILDVVVSFCEENEIRYFLTCGTLLGAVRHKAYIPWDDDIDIGMLREDYDRFMAIFNKKNDRYQLISPEMDENYHLSFIKVFDTKTTFFEPDETGLKMCINIDVFPYDAIVNDTNIAKKMYDRRDFYKKLAQAQVKKSRPYGNAFRQVAVRVLRAILQCFPRGCFMKKMNMNARKFQNEKTGFIGNMTQIARFILDESLFVNLCTAEFEGKKYKIPTGYDEFLCALYGDYMKLPPENERVAPHDYVAYINDDFPEEELTSMTREKGSDLT